MYTIINYILMAFLGFLGILWSYAFKDYKQSIILWACEGIGVYLLWYYLNWPIPYALFAVTIAVGAINPFKPMEGTATAEHEEKQKIEAEKYRKEHPFKMHGSDAHMAEMASWVKHFGR